MKFSGKISTLLLAAILAGGSAALTTQHPEPVLATTKKANKKVKKTSKKKKTTNKKKTSSKKRTSKKSKKSTKKASKKKVSKKKTNKKSKKTTKKAPKKNTRAKKTTKAPKRKPVGVINYNVERKRKQNLTSTQVYDLKKGLLKRVIQKPYLKGNEIYALQLYKHDIVVKRAKLNSKTPVFSDNKHSFYIVDGRHTQTWDYAGNGYWFIGTAGKKDPYSRYIWDRQIARVKYQEKKTTPAKFVRLTDINKASDDPNYTSGQVQRVEATVSPNGKYFLIGSISSKPTRHEAQTVHFAIYDLSQINRLFNQAEREHKTEISLSKIKPLSAFHDDHGFGNYADLQSFQGMAVDNDRNIYITVENPPIGNKTVLPRQIVRIPWGDTNSDDWTYGNLDHKDWATWNTEVESLQIIGKDIYYDMAFHDPKTGTTEDNRLYRVKGFVKTDHIDHQNGSDNHSDQDHQNGSDDQKQDDHSDNSQNSDNNNENSNENVNNAAQSDNSNN